MIAPIIKKHQIAVLENLRVVLGIPIATPRPHHLPGVRVDHRNQVEDKKRGQNVPFPERGHTVADPAVQHLESVRVK